MQILGKKLAARSSGTEDRESLLTLVAVGGRPPPPPRPAFVGPADGYPRRAGCPGISALRSLAWLAVVCLFTSVTEVVVSRGHRRRLRRALSDEAEATTPGAGEPGPSGLSPF
ncbi:hypothetical protein Misp04_48020 [Micromonospora sp. NBRC 101691]|nr:hypothetical protein Misp04_48020 [Micromonospora sp. NBRC 101691]